MKKIITYYKNNAFALSCLLLFVAVFTIFPLFETDFDILWHFKLGEQIVDTRTISIDNTFSFLPDTKWLQQEWLFDVIIYYVLRYLGEFGYCLLYALNLIFLFIITIKTNGCKNRYLYLFFFVVADILIVRNRGCRPSEFSMYLIPLIIWMYCNIKGKKRFLCYMLYGIFAANFHCGVLIISIPIFLLLMLSDIVSDRISGVFRGFKYYLKHCLDLGVLLIGSLINPSGYKLLLDTIKISGLNSTRFIDEWQPASFNYLLAIFILSIVISFGYTIYKKNFSRNCIMKITILSALLVLSLVSKKAFLLFEIVWFFYGYEMYEVFILEVFRRIRFTALLNRLKIGYLWVSCLTNATLIIFISIFLPDSSPVYFKSFKQSINDELPYEIINTLINSYTEDTKILASYSNSNYILFNDMKCFVDTRQWPYAKELNSFGPLDELIYVSYYPTDTAALDSFIDKYEFDYIWVDSDIPINTYLDSRSDYDCIITYVPDDCVTDGNIYDRTVYTCEYLYKKRQLFQ